MKNNKYFFLAYITICFFIIHVSYEKIISLSLISILILDIVIRLYKKYKLSQGIKIKKLDLFLYTVLVFSYFIAIITTKYSIKYITFTLLFFIIIIYNFYIEDFTLSKSGKSINKFLYVSIIISIIIQSLNYSPDGFKLISAWDKNYTGVILFLFFMYCNKMKYKMGIVLSLCMTIIVNSRGYILMIFVFYIVKLTKLRICKKRKLYITNKISNLLIIMFIFIGIFSYYWVYVIAANGVKEYQSGINDTSNKMRFAANIKTYRLIKNNKHLLINGYDNDIKEVLGLNYEDHSKHSIFEGVRLVQTHNSMLNIIIKMGIMFSLIYFTILSRILEKYNSIYNTEYIIPYLLNSMFMHSMLDGRFLLFWLLILSVDGDK